MKQQGTFFHASGSVFTIKATRRQFAQPEPVRIPPFVRKAIEEYEHQYDVYNKALQKREQRGGEGARSELTPCPETEATAATCTTPPSRTNSSSTASPEPLPPTLPFTAQQFIHKPLRFFPPTPESIHTPFRVSVLSPKKTISKLAVYRTLCRRKFYQAIEKVFRGRAQPGFDYMIFAGKDSILTPQSRLEQLLIKALEDPRLHGGRFKSQKSSSTKNGAQGRPQVVMPETLHSSPIAQNKNAIAAHSPRAEGTEGEEAKEQCLQEQINSSPRLRYKDDKKPPLKNFWKHALPNPLPRKLFPEHYLDQYVNKGDPNSPEHKRAVVLRQRQGMWLHLRKVINKEKQLKAVKAAEERNKLLAQHRAFVDSLIEKHFAQRS
ncbi:hypothetical protein BGW41_004967 [Actinomortierella wolfii]|nr:hypothetical protein BGW41_004967 [Actinomortierella wolfii]